MNYHINNNGDAAICKAKPGTCPFGSDSIHSDNPQRSRKLYEEKMKNELLRSTGNSFITIPDPFRSAILQHPSIREVSAYGYAGSHMYGLSTPESDLDLSIIVPGKERDKQFLNDEYDLRVYPVDQFLRRLWTTSLPEIDLLYSRGLSIANNSPYEGILATFRFSPYSYYKNTREFAKKTIKTINEYNSGNKRELKTLKSSFRTLVLGSRAIEQGPDFDPRFTAKEKELFFNLLEERKKSMHRGLLDDELIASLNEIASRFSKMN